MKVLLINLPVHSKSGSAFFLEPSTADIPLNLCQIGAFLLKNGHEPEILDLNLSMLEKFGKRGHNTFVAAFESGKKCSAERMKFLNNLLFQKCKMHNLIAINCDEIEGFEKTAPIIKSANSSALIVAGGRTATMNYEKVLKIGADFVVLGDGELPLLNIIEAVQAGKGFSSLKNVAHMSAGKLKLEKNPQEIEKTGPLRSLSNPLAYARYSTVTPVISSRGCRGNCFFCSRNIERGYSLREPKLVAAELKQANQKYGIKGFLFYNDNINNEEEHLRKLCMCIIKSKLRIKWFSYARAEHFSEDTIALMHRSGCRKISFGIESGSQRMLDIMNKHISIKDSIRTLSLFRKHGIAVRESLIYDIPSETISDILLSLKFLIMTKPSQFRFYPLRIVSGSVFYECYEKYFSEKKEAEGFELVRKKSFFDKIKFAVKNAFFFILNKYGSFTALKIFYGKEYRG